MTGSPISLVPLGGPAADYCAGDVCVVPPVAVSPGEARDAVTPTDVSSVR